MSSVCEKAALLCCDFWRIILLRGGFSPFLLLTLLPKLTFCLALLALLFGRSLKILLYIELMKVRLCGIALPLGLVRAAHKRRAAEGQKRAFGMNGLNYLELEA